jgi:hypothetical protein
LSKAWGDDLFGQLRLAKCRWGQNSGLAGLVVSASTLFDYAWQRAGAMQAVNYAFGVITQEWSTLRPSEDNATSPSPVLLGRDRDALSRKFARFLDEHGQIVLLDDHADDTQTLPLVTARVEPFRPRIEAVDPNLPIPPLKESAQLDIGSRAFQRHRLPDMSGPVFGPSLYARFRV